MYASGKHAFSICDRCAGKTPYGLMRTQIFNEQSTGLRVCPDCFDQDHPQLQVGKYPVHDNMALEYPRKETIPEVTTAWTPVFQTGPGD